MTKGTELTPKLSTNMISSSRKLFVETLSLTDFSLKTLRRGFGSLGAYQRKEEGVRSERRGGLFIEKVHHQLSDRAANVRQP
jgi:hypothetical protein